MLYRLPSDGDRTIGRLYSRTAAGLVGLCFTCEDVVREVAGVPVERWKIPKVTAIPAGRYRVIVTMSARFKRPLPLLLNVPGFTGIRLHPGTSDEDTEGCLLLGGTTNGEWVLNSRVACDQVQSMIEAALTAGDVWIEVINAVAERPA
jgi:hypothetical protein